MLFCGREGIKSVINDIESFYASFQHGESNIAIHNESANDEETTSNHSIFDNERRRSGPGYFRRRQTTVSTEGPTGAPPLGSFSIHAGAAGGGPAAWAAAAFGRGDDRKVSKIIFLEYIIG